MIPSSVEANLKAVKRILEEQPATTHINIRRADGLLVDIPLNGIDMTIKNHPTWMVDSGSHPDIPLAQIKNKELPIVPAKPSEEELKVTEPTNIPVRIPKQRTVKK